ncbi:MAG: hypothetical protein MJZ25_03810 [Fibrobacter sp.]|nr:hypothetical protein [Fibrobacter sp.]
MESPKMLLLSNTGKFNQAMALISESITDLNTKAMLSTHENEDGLIMLDIDTENGIHTSVSTMLSSAPFEQPVFIFANDLCVASKKIRTEKATVMWIADGKLYMGAYYNDRLEGFELECGFKPAGEFFPMTDINPTSTVDIDQMTFNTVIDALYEFDSLEIYRKNGIVSFRTGDDRITIATVMQAATTQTSDAPDFSIRIAANTFKVLPLIKSISDELDAVVKLEIDDRLKYLRLSAKNSQIVAGYENTKLETFTSTGLKKFITIDSGAIAASIDIIFGINYINPTGMLTISAIDEGTISVENSDEERIHVNLSVGEVTVHDQSMKVKIPADILTMMIRNSNCPKLTLEIDQDSRKMMMRYGNGLFLRKCTASY